MNEKAEHIGWLSKIHGINGHLILRIEDTSEKDFIKGDYVFLKINGLLVPFFISDIIEKDDSSFIIQFEDFQDSVKAEELKNKEVYIPLSKISPSKKPYEASEKITDYIVIDDTLGEIGNVHEIIDISNNPLIKVINNTREILIPYNEEIVKKTNTNTKTINVSLPDGLIDLFS